MVRGQTVAQPHCQFQRLLIVYCFESSTHAHQYTITGQRYLLLSDKLLGLPVWSDKLLAEVVRLILNAYYDVQFSDHSHGFRERRGCHTALQEIYHTWGSATWIIEGDISDCFGSLPHEQILSALSENIH